MNILLIRNWLLPGLSFAITFACIPVFAQVNVDREPTGTCSSGPNTRRGGFVRVGCHYPSEVGTYSNVRAIEYRGGSGADVSWVYENPSEAPGSITRVQSRICGIGSSQFNQSPRCENPFRGVPIKIEIVPHNNSWQTDFALIPE
ncbi:hypothetical protein H6F86_24425 [Phormidium sp. FACHB-592]|uniref:Secreted protein n=1 Tax=Stenomitos frigidus AS-A4 TaxID=2933935 RepID=A0ABV0KKC5_9CYAN|nr:hypothetical protein [Phormidium sp. FACHB-592]MBD2076974.1 hypothetical protein [Phormidium sp. FACHB-592]